MSASRGRSGWKICEFVAHGSTVNCLALSPSNGRTLATGGDDRKINLWIVGQPNVLTSISGITSPVQSVAFNNTENWIGAGSKSGVIKVFDLEENKSVRSISGHKAAICSLDFHRYGDILASGSMDTNLKLWDVRRKGCIFTYKAHTEIINSIQFSPDGKWIVSASSDGTTKIWDLSAGRMIADFREHTGPVMTVQFHPKEFLLATGSSDRTARFWDLERFQMVSQTAPEASSIRCLQFHSEGSALFSGSQDSLRVYGWEPAVTYDVLALQWGKVADLTVSGEQLLAAAFSQTNVSLWCIDLKRMRPFSGESSSPVERNVAPPLSASGRRLFEYQQEELKSERPHTQASGPKPHPQNQPRSASREGSEGGDSPPTEVKESERKQIFAQRQKLIRTPPKQTPAPFRCPPEDHTPAPPIAIQPLEQRPGRLLGGDRGDPRQNVVQNFMAPPPAHSQPRPVPRVDSRVFGEINTNHIDVCQILKSRLTTLKRARAEWSMSDPKSALEVAVNSGNQSTLVDMLSVLQLKRTLWTLDMAVIIVPELKFLLKSKYPSYVACGCSILKLVLKSFGPVIKTNVSSPPPQGGVDITREERYDKCHTCHSHLLSLRQEAERLLKDSGLASKVLREHSLLDAFSILD